MRSVFKRAFCLHEEENDISEYRPIGNIADILQIIDKYKGESEG